MRTSLISSLIGGAAALAAQPAAADPYSLCWSDGQHLTCGRVDPLVPPIDRVTDVDVLGIPSTVAGPGGRQDSIVRGADQHVRHAWAFGAYWSDGGWADWGTPATGATLGNPELIVAGASRVAGYVRATTGSRLRPQDKIWVHTRDLVRNTGSWRSLGRPVTLDGTGGVSNVAAAAMSNDVLTAYVHVGDHLWETYSIDGGATYVAWYDLGAPADAPHFDSDPDATALDSASVDLVVHASDGSIRRWRWRASTGAAWSVLPAAPAGVALRNPTVTSSSGGLIVVALDAATTKAYQWREGETSWTAAYPANYVSTAVDIVP